VVTSKIAVATEGSKVTILREDKVGEQVFCLCDRTDIGKHEHRLDCRSSPLGIRLMGKKAGQTFQLPTPKGLVTITVVAVAHEEPESAAA